MEQCVIPVEIFAAIAECHYSIYGALLETCRELYKVLSGMNPWKLFTYRDMTHVNKRTCVFDKITGNPLFAGISHKHGASNLLDVDLYKRFRCKVSICMINDDNVGITRYRVTYRHPDRNEIEWSEPDYCNRLISSFGLSDQFVIPTHDNYV